VACQVFSHHTRTASQILCKKTQNITLEHVLRTFCAARRAYDCVATFSSPHAAPDAPGRPSWIADGVAISQPTDQQCVQYFSPKGLRRFLTQVRWCSRCTYGTDRSSPGPLLCRRLTSRWSFHIACTMPLRVCRDLSTGCPRDPEGTANNVAPTHSTA
jgi:hypothetical protein